MTFGVRKQKAVAMIITLMLLFTGIWMIFPMFSQLGKASPPFTDNIKVNWDSDHDTQNSPDIAVDSSGMVYAVWEDWRNQIDSDIYFSNSSDGGQNWRNPDVKVDSGSDDQTNPAIAVNLTSGALYVTWQDKRSGDFDIYFANSTDNGATWSPINVKVNGDTLGDKQGSPDIAWDPSTGAIHAVWEDYQNGDYDIYYSRSTDGGATWSSEDRISTDTADQRYPSIAVDSLGKIFVVWEDKRAGSLDTDIYSASSTDGGSLWTDPNIKVNNETGVHQYNPSVAVDNAGTVYVVWEDYRIVNPDIYLAKSIDDGDTWPINVRVNDDAGVSGSQKFPDIAVNLGTLNVVWEDNRDGDYDIYFSNSTDGGISWGNNDKRVNDDLPGHTQGKPTIAVDPTGIVYAAWEDDRTSGTTDVDIYSSSLLTPAPAPTPDRFFISWSSDGSSGWVTDGTYDISDTDEFYAVGWNDTLNVSAGLISVTWGVTNSIGDVSPTLGTGTTFTATTQGMGQVTATDGSLGTNETGTLTVSADGVDRIIISLSPDASTGWIGNQYYTVSDTQTFYACGWNDTDKKFIELVDAVWNSDDTGVGDVSSPGPSSTFTANGDGTCQVTANHALYGSNETGILTVTSYEIDRIFISLSSNGALGWIGDRSYPEGETDTFYACGWNDTSDLFVKLVDADWSSDDSGVGDVTLKGKSTTFSALNAGTCKVLATNTTYGVNLTDVLTVFELEIDEILISLASDGGSGWVTGGSYAVEDTDIFYATGWNKTYNQFIGLVEASWTISEVSVGTVDPLGLWTNFTALQVSSDSTCTVTAEYSGIQNSTGTLNVLAPKVDYIQIHDAANNGRNILDTATFIINDQTADQATYYAAGYNYTVGYIGDVNGASWGVTNNIGVVDPAVGNSTTFSATNAGIGKITVTFNGITNESGDITVDIFKNTPPSQPGQPTLEVKGKDKIEIKWPANTESDLKKYVIQRAESADGPWTNITTVDNTTTTFTDSGLEKGTKYYYRVIAVDSSGLSSTPSPVVSATTEKEGDGDGEFPWIILILLIIIILVIAFLLFFMMKKKEGA